MVLNPECWVDSNKILHFSLGSGGGFKNLWINGRGSAVACHPHQVSHCGRTFDALLLRNNLHRFFIRCTSSSNFFIRSVQMPDALYKSSYFLNYSTLLHDGNEVQQYLAWAQLGGGHVPHFFRRGGHNMLCPPTFFSLGFVFGEVTKIKMTFVTFHVRCIAKPSWCWNRVWCDTTDSDIFISFHFDKMIFSILQFFRGRERLLTASLRHFTLCGFSDVYSRLITGCIGLLRVGQ